MPFRPPARPAVRPATPAVAAGWVAVGACAAFVVLTLAVTAGALDRVDVLVRGLARPDEVWGPAQLRADLVVENLRPAVMTWFAGATALVLCAVRRSWRPLAVAALTGSVTSAVVLSGKAVVARQDPHGLLMHGGSFPSGHTTTIMVSLGLVVLLVRPEPPPAAWLLPAVAGAGMGTALLVEGAHWATDVVGGGLLAAAVLAALRATGVARWAGPRRPRRSDREPGCPQPDGRGADLTVQDQARQAEGDIEQPRLAIAEHHLDTAGRLHQFEEVVDGDVWNRCGRLAGIRRRLRLGPG